MIDILQLIVSVIDLILGNYQLFKDHISKLRNKFKK